MLVQPRRKEPVQTWQGYVLKGCGCPVKRALLPPRFCQVFRIRQEWSSSRWLR